MKWKKCFHDLQTIICGNCYTTSEKTVRRHFVWRGIYDFMSKLTMTSCGRGGALRWCLTLCGGAFLLCGGAWTLCRGAWTLCSGAWHCVVVLGRCMLVVLSACCQCGDSVLVVQSVVLGHGMLNNTRFRNWTEIDGSNSCTKCMVPWGQQGSDFQL